MAMQHAWKPTIRLVACVIQVTAEMDLVAHFKVKVIVSLVDHFLSYLEYQI